MNLAALIAREQALDSQKVMLLRHSNTRVAALQREGASIEEYSLVQPTDTRYDYLASDRPPISCVVVVANDHVHSIYRIEGVEAVGTTHSLTSPAYVRFDRGFHHQARPAKRYRAKLVKQSRALGLPVHNWTSHRTPVARYGGKLHESVSV